MTPTGYRSLSGHTVNFIGRDEIGDKIKSVVELLSGRWQPDNNTATIIVYDDGIAHFEELHQLAEAMRLQRSSRMLLSATAFFEYVLVTGPSQELVPTHRFNPPPGWEIPPPGWVPHPGWQPPKEWIPAPPGWNFWIENK